MKRLIQRLFWSILILVALMVAGIWYLATRDYTEYYHERRGILATVHEEKAGSTDAFTKSWLRLKSSSGFTVDCGILVPKGKGEIYPAIVLLGGSATGKHAIDYALDIDRVVIVAVDYPYTPRDKYTVWNFLKDVPSIRRALIDMMPSVMLVTDYLWQRPDVDTSRIVVLGYSFGAPFAPCIMANDPRPAAAVMVYGGGDLGSLIGHNIERYEGHLPGVAAGFLSGILLRPVEPMRFAGLIAPRPLVMINGTHDEQVPRRNAELLFAAAREPKKQVWLESKHVNPRNLDLTIQIVGVLKRELRAVGILGH
jgi:hypothetical protein